MTDTVFFHATDLAHLPAIGVDGLRAKSYLTIDADIATYYAETISDEDGVPVILAVDLSDLDAAMLSPDLPGIEEPITTLLGDNEDTVHARWDDGDQTWQQCLAIVKSVRYDGVIPAAAIRVVDGEGGQHRLSAYLVALTTQAEWSPSPHVPRGPR